MSRDDISVTVSAPGKVILYGEHSVVYGKLAIASSLGLRTTVTLRENRSGILAIVLKDLNFSKEYDLKDFSNITIPLSPDNKYSWKHPNNIAFESLIETIADSFRLQDAYKKDESLTLTALFYLYCGIVKNVPVDGLLLEVSTDLTLGSGTGSSASVMVALAGAFVKYRLAKTENAEADKQFVIGELNIISDWAFHAEKIIHGNPSGIDNTICCFGSMVSFRKGVEPQPIKTTHEIRCILVDTKVPKDTKVQVRKVADLKQRFPKVVDAVLNGMDELTSEAAECLFCLGLAEELPNSFDEIYNRLNELTDINQNLLRSLDVSHPALEEVVSMMSRHGLHGKITGAGGGGYAYAFISPNYQFNELDTLCNELSSKGYQPLVTKLGGPGITVETS